MRTDQADADAPAHGPRPRRWLLWCVVFAAASALYIATANSGPQWQDSGWQQHRIITGELVHPFGLALTHPLQYYFGRALLHLPFLEPAFAITLVSCLMSGVAVANVALTLFVLTRSWLPVALASGALVVSHTFWQHGTHTESYALMAALVTGEWLCMAYYATTQRGGWLVPLVLLNGLGVANHLLAGLATPVNVGLVIYAVRRGHLSVRLAVASAVWWAVASLPYSGLVMMTYLRTGELGETIRSALFGTYDAEVLNRGVSLRLIARGIGYAVYNFPGLTLLWAGYALIRRVGLPRVMWWCLTVELAIYVVFVSRYTIVDQYSFFFPVYLILIVFAGLGIHHVVGRLAGVRDGLRRAIIVLTAVSVLWTPLVYVVTSRVLAARGDFRSLVRNKPYRDGYRTFFIPWGAGETCAVTLNTAAYELAGDNGLILVGDGMMYYGVLYPVITGRAPADVQVKYCGLPRTKEIVAECISLADRFLREGRTVVLVPVDRDDPNEYFGDVLQWVRRGDIYVLAGVGAVPASAPVVDQ